MKGQLELKVKRDSRSKLIDQAFVKNLRTRYNVSENKDAIKYFNDLVTEDYYNRSWSIPEDLNKTQILNTIGIKEITYADFASYLHMSQRKNRTKNPLNQIIEEQYNAFLNQSVLNYYEENLENENQEFANIVGEYRDGLLLFDLMESEIWNAAKKDSLGLKEFYNMNKDTYFVPEKVDAVVASSSKRKNAKKVLKYFNQGQNDEQISKFLNKKGKVNVMFTKGELVKDHQAIPPNFEFKEGVSKIYEHNNSFIVAMVNKVIPKEYLSFTDAKGRVISDFQEQKEKDWLAQLHKAYEVKVNNTVLSQIKAQIKG